MCVQCHLGGYEGDSRIPRLAGLQPEYLKKTMLDFKTKARANSPAKGSLMASYSNEDIEALADFVAGF
jgi:cytochrome c553